MNNVQSKLIWIRASSLVGVSLIISFSTSVTGCSSGDPQPDLYEGEYYYDNPACPVAFWFNVRQTSAGYVVDGAQVNYYLLNDGFGVSPNVELGAIGGGRGIGFIRITGPGYDIQLTDLTLKPGGFQIEVADMTYSLPDVPETGLGKEVIKKIALFSVQTK